MKLIKQHDSRDCGATCLSMVASYHGLKYPISKYRELTKTDQNGASIYGLCDAGKKIGFNTEALSGSPEDLINGIQNRELSFPFIAHITNEDRMLHFIVVCGFKNGKFSVADPAKGRVKYSADEFFGLWNGYIVTFEKSAKFEKGNYNKGGFNKFFNLLKGQFTNVATVVFLSIVISLIGIIGAFVFQVIVDDFYTSNEITQCDENCDEDHEHAHKIIIEGGNELENIIISAINFVTDNSSNFNAFFTALIFLYVLQAFIQLGRGYLMSKLSKNIDIRLMLSYYNHVIDLPMSSVATRNTGEYLSRFSDASTIRNAVSGATLTLLLDSIMVVFCGIILYQENPTLFFISLAMVLIYALVVLCYKKPIKNINREVMENNARVQSFLKESIDGIQTVKTHRAEEEIKAKNSSKFNRFIKSVFKESVIEISQDSISGLVESVGTVIILWVGFGLVLKDVITIGSLITFYALLAYFTEPIKNLIQLQPMMQTAIVAAERLNDILDSETEKSDDSESSDIEWNSIGFENVDFRYGNHELVLKNISLEIKKGEKIAIVGESGSGKTTLAKLLLRFYSPEKGSITIDGKAISDISVDKIRNDVAYIDQNTFLFSDTVRNNLKLGNEAISDAEIEEACRITKSETFIKNLPFRYDTLLEENGRNLSGGQRQRLAIARALLRRPKVLIMDEATSNLDTITETAIKETIFGLDSDMTCIVIAHRLTTIKNCDRIFVMEDGEFIECGSHEELIALKGRYYDFFSKNDI